jgi:hypothetical protein
VLEYACCCSVLVQCMTDPSQDAETLLCTVTPTPTDDQAAFVLAVRGLLAHGILQHCLQKRHRVDYGVFRCAGQHAGESCTTVVYTKHYPK